MKLLVNVITNSTQLGQRLLDLMIVDHDGNLLAKALKPDSLAYEIYIDKLTLDTLDTHTQHA